MILIKKQRGQVLIEVLVASGILVLVSIAISTLAFSTFKTSELSLEKNKAVFLAQEGLDAARSIRDEDFNNLTVGSHGISISGGSWTFSASSDNVGDYSRIVDVQKESNDLKKVESVVSWEAPTGTKKVRLTTYLADRLADENAPNPPTVNTTNIGQNTAQLNATVTDPDGNNIDAVEFYNDINNNLIVRATTTKDSPANYEVTWDGLSSNTDYYWYAKAKDVTGLVSDKSDVASFKTGSKISSCQDYCGTQGYDNGGCVGSYACSLWGGTVESGGDEYCSTWWTTCCCWNW